MERGGPGSERRRMAAEAVLEEGCSITWAAFSGFFFLKMLPRRCQLAERRSITAASLTLRDNCCLPNGS